MKEGGIMAYAFDKQKVASFQLNAYSSSGGKVTYKGVDGTQTSADIIVGGIQQLLGIVGWENKYEPTDAKRTIDERVIEE